MTALVIRADARQLPLPDASVDLIATSPPYFGLRSYLDAGEHYVGQLGAEESPAAYLDELIACTREWMRVLKGSGSLWVNLGDKYGGASWETKHGERNRQTTQGGGLTGGKPYIAKSERASTRAIPGTRLKCLMGLPWRYALRCTDELGLILRAEVIWSKPNGLPESVADRVGRSHEQWFHFVKEPRYFAAVDAIRLPHVAPGWQHGTQAMASRNANLPRSATGTYGGPHPIGKIPTSVWDVATEPLRVPEALGVDHFAAFPTELPRRIILGWSPTGICVECGQGRHPVITAVGLTPRQIGAAVGFNPRPGSQGLDRKGGHHETRLVSITGEACGCPEATAATRPAVVLDPFGGTGTTALVASAHGRIGISIDRSADYCRIARWRTTDPAQRAKALGVDKPPVELPGQASLLDHMAAA